MPRSISFALVSLCAVLSASCSFQPKEGAGAGSGTGSASGSGASGGTPTGPVFDGSIMERSYMAQDAVNTAESCPSNSFMANSLPPDLLI
ncbi:MAG: hypothetical protein ABJA82_17225, partial [Myxococcales bacterium]